MPSPLFACAACYGKSDSPLASGMNWGIFTLMGVIITVLASIPPFFFFIIRREAVLLIFIAVPLWAKAVDKFPDAKDSTVIQVVAQQFAWNARYGGIDGVFGKQDMRYVTTDNVFGVDPSDPNGKDDVQVLNEIHV